VYASFKTVVTSYEKNDSAVRMVENARAALGDMTITLKGITAASTPFIQSFATNTAPIMTTNLDTAALVLAASGYGLDSVHFIGSGDVDYWYFLDTTNSQLMRNTAGTIEPLAFSVISSNFLFFDRNTASQEWNPPWNSSTRGIPRSIYIALTVKDDNNRLEPHTYTTLVTLP
jgi:hypothetical protein